MKLKPERPAFNMPLADLLILGPEKVAYTRRAEDADVLTKRGWTPERISAVEDQFTAIGKLPTDTELEQGVRKVEEKKNELRETTTTLIQTALGKVNQVHHDESAQYRAFGSAKLYKSGDPGFAIVCEQVSRAGQVMLVEGDEEEQAEYAAAGLTPAEFIAIGANGDEFRRLLVDIRAAEAKRDLGTQKRLELANPAYRELAELCEVGKNVFIASDEARYNDYVIYDPAPEKAQPATDQQKLQAKATRDDAHQAMGEPGHGGSTVRPGARATSNAADDAATGRMTDNTQTDSGGRTGGMASGRDTGAGGPLLRGSYRGVAAPGATHPSSVAFEKSRDTAAPAGLPSRHISQGGRGR